MLGRRTSDEERVPRKDRSGASPFVVGLVVLIVACIGVFFGFTKHIPFTHGFRVKAVFQSSNSIRENSPVRIAGVNVGKVTKIEGKPGSDAAVVTMEINDKGLPIHKDAVMKIRPRIFLEGNFFVDVSPGTPSAPTIGDGDTIPMTQTATPVQFDQVLTTFQSDTRTALQKTLEGLGTGLTYKPPTAQDLDAAPERSRRERRPVAERRHPYGARSLRGTAIVTDAFLGTEHHDLSTAHRRAEPDDRGPGRATRSSSRTWSRTSTGRGGHRVGGGQPARLDPPARADARERQQRPGRAERLVPEHARLRARDPARASTRRPPTIDAAFPWIAQAQKLLGPTELQGVVERAAARRRKTWPRSIDATLQLLPQADLVAKCATNVVLPTGDIKIARRPLSTSERELQGVLVLDGRPRRRGPELRRQRPVRPLPARRRRPDACRPAQSGDIAGDSSSPTRSRRRSGTRPAYPGKRPPYNPTLPLLQEPDCPTSTAPPRGRPTAARATRADDGAIARRAAASRDLPRADERDPQARARLRLVIGARAGGAARGRLHPRPTSASTCPSGSRSSARTSSTTRPSSRPRSRSRRARARRSTSRASSRRHHQGRPARRRARS